MDLFDNKEKTNIEELGEFGLIDHLTKNIKLTRENTLKGVGDDAAGLDAKEKNIAINRYVIGGHSFRFGLYAFKAFRIQGSAS